MAKFIIRVDADNSQALNKLNIVKQRAASLNDLKIKIHADVSDFEVIDKAALKAMQASAKIENAHARQAEAAAKVKAAEAQLAAQREKTNQSANRRAAEEAKLATQIERTATAEEQARIANTQLSTQIERTATAEAQATLQAERTATVRAQTALQTERTATEEARLAVQQERTATASVNLQNTQERAALAIRDTGTAAQTTARQTETLWTNIAKFGQWYLIGGTFTSIIGTLRDAVDTLKAVDTELVNIQKTTDFSGSQIDELTDKAYKLASAYGRQADELLSVSTIFARAGMGEHLAEMTELAALTENVGDLTGETAAKFLIAANAAWQLGGDYNALLQIIDGLNMQTNKAAVDMAALTEGITVAGSVFANSGESAQTFAGMLGAAVAATQRSGSEVARGLRTIAMNVRQVKGELEDGEIVDEESVSKAAEALASVGVHVADANGELRLTSDVLDDLAGKWDSLTSAQQSYLAQDLAGKRQANILTALMQNWGEAERQMTLYAEGAGSALRENELYLDSWEAKSKSLSAEWAELVSHLADSRTVKDGLELATAFVNGLDTGAGRAAITVTGLAGAWALLGNLISTSNPVLLAVGVAFAAISTAAGMAAKAQEDYAEHIHETYPELSKLKDEVEELTKGYQAANDTIANVERETEAAAQVVAHYAERLDELAAVIEDENTSQEQAAEAKLRYKAVVETLNDLIPSLNLVIDEQTGLLSNEAGALDELTAAWKRNAIQQAYQEQYTELYKRQAEVERDKIKAAQEHADKQERYNFLLKEQERIWSEIHAEDNKAALGEDVYIPSEDYRELAAELSNVQSELIELAEQLPQYEQATADADAASQQITEDIKNLDIQLDNLAETTGTAKRSFDTLAEAEEAEAESAKNLVEVYNELKGALSPVIKALEELDSEGVVSFETMDKLVELYPELANNARLTANGYIVERSELEALIAAKKTSYQITFDNAVNAAREQINALSEEADAYSKTTEQIKNYLRAKIASLRETGGYHVDGTGGSVYFQDADLANAEADRLQGYLNSILGAEAALGSFDTSVKSFYTAPKSPGSSSGSSSSAKDEELERLKEIVKLRESELSLAKQRGDSEAEQIAKLKEIQTALHDEAEYMRSIGADQADINALSTKWWSLQKDITDLQEKMAKTLREQIAATLEDIGNALAKQKDEMLSPLNAELEALKNAHDAAKDRREEEEKILAVEQARIALENAQNERNVRVYNANTEQWEWRANAKNVEEAQKNLTDAQTALAEYYANAEYETAKDNLEKQISYTDSAFSAFTDAWKEATEAVKSGKMSYEEAYAYIKAQMQAIYDEYGIDLSAVLSDAGDTLLEGMGLFTEFIRTALQSDNPADAIRELSEAIKGGIVTDLNDVAQILKALNGDYESINSETARIWALTKMQANSVAWFSATDSEKERLANENLALGTSMGWTRKADGYWYDQSGNRAYSVSESGSSLSSYGSANSGVAGGSTGQSSSAGSSGTNNILSQMQKNSAAWTDASDEEKERLANENLILGTSQGWTRKADGRWYDASGKPVYDNGGILHGVGGIKATEQDEMILSPDMTKFVLDAERRGDFEQFISHLGIVTSAANALRLTPQPTNVNRYGIGTQNNNNGVYLNNLEFKNVTKGTTIGELAEMARGLALH